MGIEVTLRIFYEAGIAKNRQRVRERTTHPIITEVLDYARNGDASPGTIERISSHLGWPICRVLDEAPRPYMMAGRNTMGSTAETIETSTMF